MNVAAKFFLSLRCSSVKMSRIAPSSSLDEQKIYRAKSQAIRGKRNKIILA